MKYIIMLALIVSVNLSCGSHEEKGRKDQVKPAKVTNELCFLLGVMADYFGFDKSDIKVLTSSESNNAITKAVIDKYCRNERIISKTEYEGGRISNPELQNIIDTLFENKRIRSCVTESFSMEQKRLFIIGSYLREGDANSWVFCNGCWKKQLVETWLSEVGFAEGSPKIQIVDGFPGKTIISFKPTKMFRYEISHCKEVLKL